MLQTFRHIIFGYYIKYCVGVELSSQYIKIVQLNSLSLSLINYKIQKIPRDISLHSNLFTSYLSNIIHNYPTKIAHVAMHIPFSSIITKEITIPDSLNKHEQVQIIHHKLTTDLGITDIVFDFEEIAHVNDEIVMNVAIAKRNITDEVMALASEAKFKLAVLSISTMVIANFFEAFLNKINSSVSNVLALELSTDVVRLFYMSNNKCIYFDELLITSNNQDTATTESIGVRYIEQLIDKLSRGLATNFDLEDLSQVILFGELFNSLQLVKFLQQKFNSTNIVNFADLYRRHITCKANSSDLNYLVGAMALSLSRV